VSRAHLDVAGHYAGAASRWNALDVGPAAVPFDPEPVTKRSLCAEEGDCGSCRRSTDCGWKPVRRVQLCSVTKGGRGGDCYGTG